MFLGKAGALFCYSAVCLSDFGKNCLALNSYFAIYDIYNGALPCYLIMCLCLCEDDLNGE